jgi:hypothetical protein
MPLSPGDPGYVPPGRMPLSPGDPGYVPPAIMSTADWARQGGTSSAVGSTTLGQYGQNQVAPGQGQGSPSLAGSTPQSWTTTGLEGKGGPGIMGNSLYGTSREVNDPGAFWRDYLNQEAGIPGFSSSSDFLTNTFGDPAGLMMAMGNTGGMEDTQGSLNAMRALAGMVGGASPYFDPKALIRSVLSQVAQFDPSKVSQTSPGAGGQVGAGGGARRGTGTSDAGAAAAGAPPAPGSSNNGGSLLGMELYDPDPEAMANNVVKFVTTILKGIVPDRVLNAIGMAMTIAAQNIGAGARQGPSASGGPSIDSKDVANAMMGALQQFGLI